jgi:kynurenine formamidase
MTKLIDLSLEITDEMPVHPYDDEVKLEQDKFLETDNYNNFRLEAGLHAGTHIDTPLHLTDRETFISEIPLDSFMGNGCLLDVRDESVIKYKQEYSEVVGEDDIVLLFTGHGEKYGTEDYFTDHPVVEQELVEFFIAQEIKMLGMDLPSPDKYPFQIHKMLFANDILLIENLTNLASLLSVTDFEVMAFPLKIKAEASITRVVSKADK